MSAGGSGGSVGSGGHIEARAMARSSRLVLVWLEGACSVLAEGKGAREAGEELGEGFG